jgi:ribosomal protein L11 methyltransferase
MRSFPAVEITWPAPPGDDVVERVLAEIDECGPTAVEEREAGVRVFFASVAAREHASAIARAFDSSATVSTIEVPDESWAERSQAQLEPVRVGRIVVSPPWKLDAAHAMADTGRDAGLKPLVISIQPSMGFGTGHHASTRLCLRLLQGMSVKGESVLDVGTGSAVLAIAAARLGARRVVAIDYDKDALTAALENVERNGARDTIDLRVFDLARDAAGSIGVFDVLSANLTGGILERYATTLASWTRAGGTLIASGYQSDEAEMVTSALRNAGFTSIEQITEDEWIGGKYLLRDLRAFA